MQNRACRYFITVEKYTPNIAVQGDMGWLPTQMKIWKSMGKCWARFKDMDNNRLNKRTFKWYIKHGENRCRNWYFKFRNHIPSLELEFLLNDNVTYSKRYVLLVLLFVYQICMR